MTKKPPEPWSSFEADAHDAAAIQALASGVANDGQQKHALALIINRICGTYDMSFRPGDEHATSFAEGKRHVGNQIVRLTKLVVKPKA
jgi:hypothetical protein